MHNQLSKVALLTFAVLGITIPAQALPNLPYQAEDQFSTTSNVNIRVAPCSTTIVGGANKGLTAYFVGDTSATKTCFGRTSKWRKVVITGPIPDEGNESIQGWVADYLLDNVEEVQKSQANGTYVRVNLNSGTLSLRKGSLNGVAIKQLPNKADVYVQGFAAPITIGGVKRYPTKVLYVSPSGIKTVGWVDATYLVAYSVYD